MERLIHVDSRKLLLDTNTMSLHCQFPLHLLWRMTLCYSLTLLFGCLILMRSDCGNIECLPHVWWKLNRLNLAIGCHSLARHRYDVLDPLVNRGVCSLRHTVYASVIARSASLALLVSIFDCLTAFRACIRGSEELLSRIHGEVKAFGEVTLEVGGAVESLALLKGDLLIHIVLASYAFFLLKKQVIC